ncbi:MAG: enoyl-CoA hydratase/isomerase family protein [Henriciella sp.]|nr:enoyl-CoA hydratase/isomerase family protein [Henriciella sp.]
MTDTVHLSHKDGIAHLVLSRPNSLNAMRQSDYRKLADLLREADETDEIKVCVISGDGDDFCAGNDIEEFAEKDRWDPTELSDPARTPSTDAVHALMDFSKPLIAGLHGRAIGFGATMLLHCDLVIAHAGATISHPFVNLGLVPEAGATFLLAERLGRARAREVLMMADPVPAPRALELGLVSEMIHKQANLLDRAFEIARMLALKSQSALIATKRLVNRPGDTLKSRVGGEFRLLAERLNDSDVRDAFKSMSKSGADKR